MNYRYEYNCSACNRLYIEQRIETQDQVVLNCECGGTFNLSNQTQID